MPMYCEIHVGGSVFSVLISTYKIQDMALEVHPKRESGLYWLHLTTQQVWKSKRNSRFENMRCTEAKESLKFNSKNNPWRQTGGIQYHCRLRTKISFLGYKICLLPAQQRGNTFRHLCKWQVSRRKNTNTNLKPNCFYEGKVQCCISDHSSLTI